MRSPSVLGRPSAVALLVVLVLAGCGGEDPPSGAAGGGDAAVGATSSATPTATPTADGGTGEEPAGSPSADDESPSEPTDPAEAPAAAPFQADTRPDTEDPVGNGLTVTDVEVGRHEGYDRVVFTLGGEGAPGWRVEYVDRPTRQGSGEPFTPAGEAFLSVLISGVGYPFDTGVEEYAGPASIPGGSAEVVREVQVQGVFEGQYDGAIGLSAERPFRVFRLEDPPRVVVDIAHRG